MSQQDRSIGPPHVTDVIGAAGLANYDWCKQEHLDRGSAVHQACEYLVEGSLDWSSLEGDPSVVLRLRQFQRFLDEVKPIIISTEQSVTHLTYGYQGTYDLLCYINDEETVVDYKGTLESPSHGVQLAAYAMAITPARPLARANLYLHDDRYKMVQRKDRGDWPVFVAALTIQKWRKRHNV
jgi:hypothetical protein